MSTKDLTEQSKEDKEVCVPLSAEEPPHSIVMSREEQVAAKCCNTMKEDVHILCRCCAYTWCCTLNGIEGLCFGLSKCCLFASEAAMGCNKCLEKIDCDKH